MIPNDGYNDNVIELNDGNNDVQPLDPRAIGYRYTYRTYVFHPARVSRYTPEICPIAAEGRGYRSSSCPLEGTALYRGIAEIASPIAA